MKNFTLFLIKKDIMDRGLMSFALSAIEMRFKIFHFEMKEFSVENMKEFYKEHSYKPFFGTLMTNVSGKIGAGILEGNDNIISEYRDYMGHTDPLKSAFGSLRARFGISLDANSFHGSDSEESFKREFKILFPNIIL